MVLAMQTGVNIFLSFKKAFLLKLKLYVFQVYWHKWSRKQFFCQLILKENKISNKVFVKILVRWMGFGGSGRGLKCLRFEEED